MQLGVERQGQSLYVFDADGRVLAYLPQIFKHEDQRSVLKNLSIFLKHFKTEVDKRGTQRVTEQG